MPPLAASNCLSDQNQTPTQDRLASLIKSRSFHTYLRSSPLERRPLVPGICEQMRSAADLDVLRLSELDGGAIKSTWVARSRRTPCCTAQGAPLAFFVTDLAFGEDLEAGIEQITITEDVYHDFDIIAGRCDTLGVIEMFARRKSATLEPAALEMITTLAKLMLSLLG